MERRRPPNQISSRPNPAVAARAFRADFDLIWRMSHSQSSHRKFVQCSCCLGIQADNRSDSDLALQSSFWQNHSSREIDIDISLLQSLDAYRSSGAISVADSSIQNANKHFIADKGPITWNKTRQEWLGDQPQRSEKILREPSISWCVTYDDLLSTHEPFTQPIPLSEMVDFLVDVWHEEGLYDD